MGLSKVGRASKIFLFVYLGSIMVPDTHQGRAEWKNYILINMSNPTKTVIEDFDLKIRRSYYPRVERRQIKILGLKRYERALAKAREED